MRRPGGLPGERDKCRRDGDGDDTDKHAGQRRPAGRAAVMGGSRLRKSLLNARVNVIFYFLSLFFAFFSRRIFLDCLGAEFIGLTGILGNILGYLNLAELGIGAAVSFFLFKPLSRGDREEISEVVSLFGYLYRRVGLFILAAGVVVSLFFPLMFSGEELPTGIVYFAFFSFMGSALISYFINYRQILLTADQKNYIVAIYFQSAGLLKTALQIFLAYNYKNLYAWVAVEFVFSVISCVVLNRKINAEYPWLRTDVSAGKALLRKYPAIIANTRNVFVHKIKDFLLTKSDEIMVFAFVSLKMVAYYGNYTMVINKVLLLFKAAMDGVGPGVGNLVAEGNIRNTMKVFWELSAIRHFIAGLVVFAVFMLIEPFIALWLGPQYVLDRTILVLLMVYQYIAQSRDVVDTFIYAHGLYADTWSAWLELALNLSVTIVCGIMYGIVGILLGKIVSTVVVIVLWKPYYLFTSGLKRRAGEYWSGALRFYAVSAVSFFAARALASLVHISVATFGGLIAYAACIVTIYLVINVPLLCVFCKGSKDCLARLKRMRK